MTPDSARFPGIGCEAPVDVALPTFLGIGTFKGATTTLFELLSTHPDIWLDPDKESDFFSLDDRWGKGRSWYEARFEPAGATTAVGEVSPSYAMYPTYAETAARARSLVPEARLVYLVRDPVERICSMYRHLASRGHEDLPFARAVLTRREYLEISRYGEQVTQWLKHFPRDQLLVVATADLAHDPVAVCAKVFAHLGVDPSFVPPDPHRRVHRTEDSPDLRTRAMPPTTLSPALRRWLQRELAPDQARFRELLGDAAPTWDLSEST